MPSLMDQIAVILILQHLVNNGITTRSTLYVTQKQTG
jgi:hypothetical protein